MNTCQDRTCPDFGADLVEGLCPSVGGKCTCDPPSSLKGPFHAPYCPLLSTGQEATPLEGGER